MTALPLFQSFISNHFERARVEFESLNTLRYKNDLTVSYVVVWMTEYDLYCTFAVDFSILIGNCGWLEALTARGATEAASLVPWLQLNRTWIIAIYCFACLPTCILSYAACADHFLCSVDSLAATRALLGPAKLASQLRRVRVGGGGAMRSRSEREIRCNVTEKLENRWELCFFFFFIWSYSLFLGDTLALVHVQSPCSNPKTVTLWPVILPVAWLAVDFIQMNSNSCTV